MSSYNNFTWQIRDRGTQYGPRPARISDEPGCRCALDPIFWMHHAMVDRVWAAWQARWPGRGPVLSGANAVMNPWSNITAASLTPTTRLNYRYV